MITLQVLQKLIAEAKANPKFVCFEPSIEKQLESWQELTNKITWKGDVSGGCGQAFTYFATKFN